MRRRKIKGAMDAFLSYEQYAILGGDATNQMLRKFADGDALHVEVGSGRGGYLSKMAKAHPDKKFVGVECKEELLMKAVSKADAEGVTNLKFVCGFAENFETWFEGLTIDTIFLNFIDPWPKARHRCKRLSHTKYINMYKPFMTSGSRLILKTDNRHLYLFSLAELAKHFTVTEHTMDLKALADPFNIETEYETRFSNRGMNIYRIIAVWQTND